MKFLTTGEFAKLCGTSKDTLFFYDKEGLLKPKYVSENGYRRYGIEQFYEFDMISIFKETGSSLKEIKSHLLERDQKKLLTLFEEKQRLLKQEAINLARRQKMLDDVVGLTTEALHAAYDVLEVVEMEEQALELMPVNPEEQATAEGHVQLLVDFARRFESQDRYLAAPFGAVVKKHDAAARLYTLGYLFCGADQTTPEPDLHIKPKGRYAVFYHYGDEDSHAAAYVKQLEEVEKSGLTIAGNIYAYEMASYFATANSEDCIVKYCVHVE